jgi:hypothetical protein
MQPQDKTEFLKILNGLAAIKPNAKLTAEGLDLYWLAMVDWPLDHFKAAAARLAKECEFFPNPYHFEKLRKAGRPTAGEAFAIAIECARHGGGSNDLTIEQAVQAMGGWYTLRMCEEDKLHFLERRFTEHYEQIQDATDTRQAVPQLAANQPLKLITDITKKLVGNEQA